MHKLLTTVFLALLLVAAVSPLSLAATTADAAADTAAYLQKKVSSPQVSSIGGEWSVLALSRGGYLNGSAYADTYYQNLQQTLRSCNGVLDERKSSEYARVVLALSALGRDARDVAGYDLVAPLLDSNKVIKQGVNGPIFALMALDSGSYGDNAIRETYLNYLLNSQLSDGGWAIAGTTADPDTTAMALQALARYQESASVQSAVQRGLSCLSALQNSDGGFSGWQGETSESVSQVIIALGELGLDINDSRFVKNGCTLADKLLDYYQPGQGFRHTASGAAGDIMASEQALCALVSLQRAQNGESSLYDMSDNTTVSRHPDVQEMPLIYPGRTFTDIAGHRNQQAIEALSQRGIINGMSATLYMPDKTMTRAEFSTIINNALGFSQRAGISFSDVKANDWFRGYVESACYYGITRGTGNGKFTPQGTISRQEAATMICRAARLCGIDTSLSASEINAELAVYSDRAQIADWAEESLAFCLQQGILELNDRSSTSLQPLKPILRSEIAQSVYNLLQQAQLL